MSKNTDVSAFGIGTDLDDEEELELDRGDLVDDESQTDADDEDEIIEADPAEQVEDEQEGDETAKEEKAEEAEEADDQTPTQEEQKPQEPKKDNRMVPRDRLNQEIAKRKAAEAQLQQALAQSNKAPEQPMTVQTLDKEMLKKALEQTLDGNTADAVEVLAQALTALQPANAPKQEFTDEDLATAVDRALQTKALANRAAEVITEYPFLDDSNDETFDSDAAEEVIVMRDLYIRRGMQPVDALNKAVAKVAEEFGYAEPEQPAPAKQMKPKPADIAKKVEIAKKTPSRIPKSVEPQGKQRVTVAEMSEDEFEKLSASELARARGDVL